MENDNLAPVISIITKNGIDKGKIFFEMLNSTLQIPYNDIILVDDSDDKRTIEAVKEFSYKNNKNFIFTRSNTLYSAKPTRATARQTAIDIFIERFDNKILIQLDDDVILRNGWWKEAVEAFKSPKIGMFYGIPYGINDLKNLQISASANKILRAIKGFYERGGTNDIAFRRETLILIKKNYGIIPPELHIYEDAWLLRAVQCVNYFPKIGIIGAVHFDPIKINRTENPSIYNTDIKYIKIASKYGIIKSVNLTKDVLGLLDPIAGYLPWVVKNIKKLGIKNGIKVTNKKQYIKLIYRYYKIKNRLIFSCKKLINRK